VWGYARSLAGIAGSNCGGGMDVCLLCYVVSGRVSARGRSLVKRSPTACCTVYQSVIEEPHEGG